MKKYSRYYYRILWLIQTTFVLTCLYTLWGDVLPIREQPEVIDAWQIIKLAMCLIVIEASTILAVMEHFNDRGPDTLG